MLSRVPLVSWDLICRPKSNGGLGVKNCIAWNTSAVGKYVWQVAQKEDVMWIKWIHCVYIKKESWWKYEAPQNASWIWKVICKVKSIFKNTYQGGQWLDGTK